MDVIQTVKLAVYDLSNGMAAAMSRAVLGQQIDGIWHTGVIVYNREYFFGGGIQMLPIGEFSRGHGMHPVSILDIGETHITSDVFHEYLHSISPRFSAATYDLISNNCNNFSHECTQFLTGSGIPSHIIDLPKIVFSTPAGAMMKPMFESMQQGVRAGNGPLDPFGAGFQPPRVAAAPVAVPAAVSTCSSSSDSGCGDKKASGGVLIDPATYSPTDVVISMPIKSQNKDSGLLSKVLEKFRNSKSSDGSGRLMMSPEELHLFTGAVETLQARPAEGSTAFSEAVYALMMRIISDHPTVQCALFYTFQLMMLYEANVGSCYLLRAMQGVAHMLDPNVTLPYEMSGPANFLAVCTLSNYFSRLPRHSSCPSILTPMLDVVIDVCTLYISKDYTNCPNRPELRQWTASLLHNIVLFQQHAGGWNRVTTGGEIHPHVVQVLCGVVEDISDEADVVVLHRRLSVAYNLLVFYPDLRALFKDVGFNLVYQDLKSRRASSLSVLTAVVDKTLGLLG